MLPAEVVRREYFILKSNQMSTHIHAQNKTRIRDLYHITEITFHYTADNDQGKHLYLNKLRKQDINDLFHVLHFYTRQQIKWHYNSDVLKPKKPFSVATGLCRMYEHLITILTKNFCYNNYFLLLNIGLTNNCSFENKSIKCKFCNVIVQCL